MIIEHLVDQDHRVLVFELESYLKILKETIKIDIEQTSLVFTHDLIRFRLNFADIE